MADTPTASPVPPPSWLSRNWKYLAAGLAIVGWALHAYQAYKSGQPIPPPPDLGAFAQQHVPKALPPLMAMGWTPDAEASAADAATAKFRTFGDTPAGQVEEVPKFVYGWKAVEILTGQPTPLKDQNPAGSCVGFGTTTSIERTLAAEINGRKGDPSEFTFFSEEVTYAGSKVEGARSLGSRVSRSDGSAGVFVKAWFAAGYGMCPKGKYDSCDLTTYSATRAQSWNVSGPPADVLAECKKYPVKDSVKVANWSQAKTAISQGYFPAVCASWSYSKQRDANGVAPTTNEGWNHCMALDGYYTDDSGKEYGHIENSWSKIPGVGPYHTGPTGWGNPTTAGFWATSDSIDRALRQGDSYAYSGISGFPARRLPLNWDVQAFPLRKTLFVLCTPFERKLELAFARSSPTERGVLP